MRISEQIIQEIKRNNDLSLDLAKKVGVSQRAVLQQAERCSRLLMLPVYVEIYKSYGFTDEQIFDNEADESRNSLQCDSSPQSRGTAEA